MIRKLDHINIVVSDLEAAVRFFLLFGFESTEPAELSGEWISSIVGLPEVKARYTVLTHTGSITNIELIEYIHPPSGRSADLGVANQIGLRHIAFEVSDIEAEVARLQSRGIKFISGLKVYQRTGKKLAYFYGPDGILMELAETPE